MYYPDATGDLPCIFVYRASQLSRSPGISPLFLTILKMFRIQVECDRAADMIRPFVGERVKDIRRSYMFFNIDIGRYR